MTDLEKLKRDIDDKRQSIRLLWQEVESQSGADREATMKAIEISVEEWAQLLPISDRAICSDPK